MGRNWGFQLIRLKWNQIAPTISKGGGASGFIHPDFARKVSANELKRIGSYPDLFILAGNRTNIQDRIGNSVPPLFMRAIAQHVQETILDVNTV
jgi:DNA (cytosine-5)-methyltransferase 1